MKNSEPRPTHKTRGPELSAREITFCQLVVSGKSQYEAYTQAGFPPRPNRQATDAAASRLVRKRQIREYIRDLQDAASAAARVTVEDLARGFRAAERADVTGILGPDGEVLPPSQWPEDVRRAITRVEVEELTELQPDPDNPKRKRKVAVGTRWKVWLENKTECRKVLAQWRRMIGADAAVESQASAGPVILGGVDPDKL